jgi:hypothetical protein
MQDHVTRRTVLGAAGVTATFGLAGCGGDSDSDDDEDEEDDDGTTDVPPGGISGDDGGLPGDDSDGGGSDDGSGGDVQPPNGSFRFEYDASLGQFTAVYESGSTIDGSNTELLVVDVFRGGELNDQLRDIWFTSGGEPLEPGATVEGTYPRAEDTTLAIRWGPPGCEGDCDTAMVTLYEESPPTGR